MKKIHFMGIGGSGANAAASIAHSMGYEVSGCDIKDSEYTQDLKEKQLPLFVGHDVAHLEDIDILCVSPALFDAHPRPEEMKEATRRGITILTWQEFLGTYLQKDKKVIAVAGTKGKSTTTSAVAVMLERAGLDPTVAVGAKVMDWDRNYRIGKGKYFVCEADEFNNNFLHYTPSIAVVNNIEMDHPEFFKSEEEYFEAFVNFCKGIKKDGVLIVNNDSLNIQVLLKLIEGMPIKIVRFGVTSQEKGDIIISSYLTYEGKTQFEIDGFLESEVVTFYTSLVGLHNLYNLSAVIAVAKQLNISAPLVQEFLDNFKGVGRRFELIHNANGIKIYNDYAHNPMSVNAALQGARSLYPASRIWAVFQPHLYSRTKMFLKEFARSFTFADQVILLDIYASREKGMPISQEISSEMLARAIREVRPELPVRAISSKEKVAEVLLNELRDGDVMINMGAGDNGIISDILIKEL